MARMIFKSWLHFVLTLAVGFSPGAFAINDDANLQNAGLTLQKAEIEKELEKLNKEYKEKCKTPEEKASKACKDIQTKIADLKAQLAANTTDTAGTTDTADASSTNGSGGGLGDAMGTILPLAAVGLMACMAMKCFDKDEDEKKNDKALLPNGALDCSKSDASRYSDCDDYLMGACTSGGGNMIAPGCAGFKNRFCAKNQTPGGVEQVELENGAVVQLNIAGSGTGQDTGYCQAIYANAYCKDGGFGQCPACLQQQAFESEACKGNPALCLAQNSPGAMADAKKKCPGDPAIALYERQQSRMGGGGGMVNTGAPAVVLPQSYSQTLANQPGAAGGISTGGSGGISTSSVRGGVSAGTAGSEGAAREGQTGYQGGSAATGAFSGASTGGRAAPSREVAGLGASSVGSGPASDVLGQYGPNLFAAGSQAIRNHCQQKRFTNCP